MATNGYLTRACSGGSYTFYVYWEVLSQSVENNTSTVYVSWGMRKTASNSASYNNSTSLNASIASSNIYDGTVAWDMRSAAVGKEKRLYSYTIIVSHNDLGKRNLWLYGSVDTHVTVGSATVSGSVALPDIARKSTVAATDANIGSVSTITINRALTNFLHTLTYAFGELSGTIATKTAEASVSFSLPVEFYAQIPAAKTGVCTITCETFNGSERLGTSTCTMMVTAAQELCVPMVYGDVVDSNSITSALTGDTTKLIKYFSTALCTISASARNDASIASKSIAGTITTGDTCSIEAVEASSFAFSAVDSRGYTSILTVPRALLEYIKLTNNATAARSSPTSGEADLHLAGNYYNGSFGAAANTLTAKYRVKQSGGIYGSYVLLSPTFSGNTYSLDAVVVGLTYTTQWVIEVTVSDALMTIVKEISVNKGIPVFDWGEEDFSFHVPVVFDTPAQTRENLGIGDTAVEDILPIAKGGTGAITANAARAALIAAARPVLLWSGSWSSGAITVSQADGSEGCTGLGSISDYAFALICIGLYDVAVAKVGSTIKTGCLDANASSELSVFANVFAATLAGDELTMIQSKWINLLSSANTGTNAITAIYGLIPSRDLEQEEA